MKAVYKDPKNRHVQNAEKEVKNLLYAKISVMQLDFFTDIR